MKLNTRELIGTELLIAYYIANDCKFQMGAPDSELRYAAFTEPDCKYGPWMVGPTRNTCLTCCSLVRPDLEDLMVTHEIGVEYPRDGIWVASIWTAGNGHVTAWAEDPHTAALRCYIVFKLGEELEIADAILEARK